jgi:hypothetical protein
MKLIASNTIGGAPIAILCGHETRPKTTAHNNAEAAMKAMKLKGPDRTKPTSAAKAPTKSQGAIDRVVLAEIVSVVAFNIAAIPGAKATTVQVGVKTQVTANKPKTPMAERRPNKNGFLFFR